VPSSAPERPVEDAFRSLRCSNRCQRWPTNSWFSTTRA